MTDSDLLAMLTLCARWGDIDHEGRICRAQHWFRGVHAGTTSHRCDCDRRPLEPVGSARLATARGRAVA